MGVFLTMKKKDSPSLIDKKSKAKAKASGVSTYTPVKPCINGHVSKRYVQDGKCYECDRVKNLSGGGLPKRRVGRPDAVRVPPPPKPDPRARAKVTIEEIKAQLIALPQSQQFNVYKQTMKTITTCFIPSPGPQTTAYYSPADVLLYGGMSAGGKSALGIGLALTAHKKSLIMRPQYTELTDLIDKTLKFYGTRDGFNGSSPPSLKTNDGRFLQFGACANPGDEYSWQGQEKDFYFFDEVVNFREDQVKFIMTWNRTDIKGQRVRTLFASNPPVNTQGDWIIGMFRPWLDITHHNPAKDGELRWFVTDKNGNDIEAENGHPIEDGYKPDGTKRLLIPKSRTFIRSSIDDNPYIDPSYRATLDAMKEPYRSAMRDGNFMMARKDDEQQLIPTAWVREAQERWTENPPAGVPMCSMGVDPAAGGEDETVLAPRYDGYYSKVIAIPGEETPFPQDVAAKVLRYRRDDALVIVDCGGGYGGGVVKHLDDNGIPVKAHKGIEKSVKRSADRLYAFGSKRSEVYYRFYEALDPSQAGGSQVALPPDPKILSDLCSVRFSVNKVGGVATIVLETKKEMKKRLGRSPDRGDAIVIGWSQGATIGGQKEGKWEHPRSNTLPKTVMGYSNRRR
jgi:hypothetical protein